MDKIRVVALQIVGDALDWFNKNGDEDHMELCEIITLEDDSPIYVGDLNKYDNWDLLFVFEDGLRDLVKELLRKAAIPEEKVIYPYDLTGSLVQNAQLMSYILNDGMRKLLRYLSYRETGEKYTIVSIPGFTYTNVSSDNVILPVMLREQENWALKEMEVFYSLSQQYYEFRKEQKLFCDIGANIGTTCIYFKKMLDKDVKILAFEPSPENYKMLRINALYNDVDISEHSFVRLGLSDECSDGYLCYDPENPGGSTLRSNDGLETQEITLVTFDDYIRDNSIDPMEIKYLWIDVEGFEGRFLAGAEDTLSKIDVPVFMEFTPCFYKDREGEFDLLMRELKKHFCSFICAHDPDKDPLPIDYLEEKRDDMSLQWDLFLLKHTQGKTTPGRT